MKHEVNLGQPITDPNPQRDAIHIAVAPMLSDVAVYPGQHCIIVDGKACPVHRSADNLSVGMVDPFLIHPLPPGQKFWLMLHPKTITGLRHEWSHPAFKQVGCSYCEGTGIAIRPAGSADDIAISERWLRDYVRRNCPYSASEPDGGYTQFIERVKEGEIFYYGSDLHSFAELDQPEELKEHLRVLGISVDWANVTYSCSC